MMGAFSTCALTKAAEPFPKSVWRRNNILSHSGGETPSRWDCIALLQPCLLRLRELFPQSPQSRGSEMLSSVYIHRASYAFNWAFQPPFKSLLRHGLIDCHCQALRPKSEEVWAAIFLYGGLLTVLERQRETPPLNSRAHILAPVRQTMCKHRQTDDETENPRWVTWVSCYHFFPTERVGGDWRVLQNRGFFSVISCLVWADQIICKWNSCFPPC